MNKPQVGIGVIVKRNNKVLLGNRINTHGDGSWCFPGGHLEFMESFYEAAKRETKEETGINIINLSLGSVTNDIFPDDNKHYVTIFIEGDYESGTVDLKEPDRFDSWDWFKWNHLPTPLFMPLQNLIKTGYSPF